MEMDISGYNGQNQVVETYDSQAIQVPQDWTPPFFGVDHKPQSP